MRLDPGRIYLALGLGDYASIILNLRNKRRKICTKKVFFLFFGVTFVEPTF